MREMEERGKESDVDDEKKKMCFVWGQQQMERGKEIDKK